MDEAKITCIYDEGAMESTLFIGAKGFSVMIEVDGEKTLFGVGRRSRYLSANLYESEIDPESISRVVISHRHIDHWGALPGLLRSRKAPLEIYAPASAWGTKTMLGATGIYLSADHEGQYVKKDVSDWIQLSEHLFISHPLKFHQGEGDEVFVVIKGKNGPILISGCCHCGLDHAFDMVKDRFGEYPNAVIGGLHIGEKKDKLADIYAEYLKTIGCKHLYLNHCTGVFGIGRLRVTLGLHDVNDFYVGQTVSFRVI